MLRLPPDGNGYLTYLVKMLNEELMRKEPTVVGLVYDPFDSAPDTVDVGAMTDGVTAPVAIAGVALIYVDAADGDLKVKFGDGTVKTLATDT